MSWLDILLIIILAAATLGGFFVGLIRSVIPLAGLILAILLAGRRYTPFSHVFGFFHNETAASAVAFILIFVVVMGLAALVTFLLSKAGEAVSLGWGNRLGGAAFGLCFGALLLGAVLALWVKFFGAGSAIAGSGLASLMLNKLPVVLAFLPGDFDAVRAFFH